MEQAAGHFLAAELASEELVIVLRLRFSQDDVQITDGAAVSGDRKERRELESDAVVGSTLESADQVS